MDTIERGARGLKEAQRHGEFTEFSKISQNQLEDV